METQIPSTSADTTQLAIIQKKLSLDSKIRSGINWYFWIAGLSLVNTIAYLLGISIAFVVGLVLQRKVGLQRCQTSEFRLAMGAISLMVALLIIANAA